MQKKFGPSNVRVNAIAPGIIDTDMNKEYTEEDIEKIISEVPLERIGKPEDIANCVFALINNEYITGQIIKVDRSDG